MVRPGETTWKFNLILILIVITAVANLADVLLKVAANDAGGSLSDPFAVFLTPWIWIGAVLGVGAMAMWVYVLGRHHISHAYPVFVGLGFINVTLASWLYFHEQIGGRRLAGIGLILAGIVVVHLTSREGSAEPGAGFAKGGDSGHGSNTGGGLGSDTGGLGSDAGGGFGAAETTGGHGSDTTGARPTGTSGALN